jgi:bacterioferritin
MKGEPKVLQNLQRALTMELTAIHQYLLHSHVVADWGLDKLAASMRAEMQEELTHANDLIERIMFLDGEPDVSALDAIGRAQGIKDMFEIDLQDEYEARTFYTKAANDADKAGDIGSRDLFSRLVLDEEGHIDWLETQLGLLQRLGEPTYLQSQMGADGQTE